MINKPKTITTYLIDGNPSGLRTVFISNKNCKALIVPRSSMDKIKDREEAFQPSLYFLLNDDEGKIYIGESENFNQRIKDHIKKKNFWNFAITFFSQNNDLTKADVKYLEHLSIKMIEKIGNINLEENNSKPSCPNLPEHQKAAMDEFFEDVKLITGFAGYNFLTEIKEGKQQDLYYCKRNGIEAKGIYDGNQFKVLVGSIIKEYVMSSDKGRPEHLNFLEKLQLSRNDKIGKNFQDLGNGSITLTKDIVFNSPSSAATFCIGNAANGWLEWKNQQGKTLDEVIRKNLEK